MLEESENIPAVEFSDDLTGLEDCLDLVYGGSVEIREDNFKTIYKFGKLFQIREMMDSVLSWIAISVTYDKFWSVYLELKNLHDDNSVFVDIIKGYLSVDGDNFMEYSREICHSQDKNTITAVVELLSRIDDIRVLSVMENIIDIATENNETLVAATASSTGNDNYLQKALSSTVSYIENVIKLESFDKCNNSRCKQVLQKAVTVCTNMETLRKITVILFETNIHKVTNIDTSIQPASSWNFTASSIKDLNWERVEQLTSPVTSYDAIKYFTENAGTGIHPCVVVEIVLKWWRVRTDREHVNMSFITPLITTIHNVNSEWYYSVCKDKRYEGLTETLDIPTAPMCSSMYYHLQHMRSTYQQHWRIHWRIVSVKEMVHQYHLRAWSVLITWRDIVYQHSDIMLLYFLLMEILYITGALVHLVLINMYLSLHTLEKRYYIILITHGVFIYILYLYLTLYNNSVYISSIFCIYVRYTFQ